MRNLFPETEIGVLILMICMLVIMIPAARSAAKNSPEGSTKDWLLGFSIMLGAGLFVFILTKLV